jgi:hypothetical protein
MPAAAYKPAPKFGPSTAPAAPRPGRSPPTASTPTPNSGALALLARAPEFGLPADYLTPGLLALRDSLRPHGSANFFFANRPEQLARLDVALSDAVLRFMRDLSRDRLRPFTPSAREKAAGPTGQSAAVLRQRLLQLALAQWLVRPAGPDSTARQQQFEQAAVNLERWR